MENKKSKIGVINEIGDLGLGFDPISEQEQQKLEEEKGSNDQ